MMLAMFLAAGLTFYTGASLATTGAETGSSDPPQIDVQYGQLARRGLAVGAYVLVEHADQKWKIAEISEAPPSITDPSRQEILVFSDDLKRVEPYFADYLNFRILKEKDPKRRPAYDPYLCFSGERKERPQYNPCDSSLTRSVESGKSLFGNVVMTVFSFGLANTQLGVGSFVSVDKEKVLAILKETDAISVASSYIRHARYKMEFRKANSVGSLRHFIVTNQNYDPESLIPVAEARIREIEEQEIAHRLEMYRRESQAAKSSSDLRVFIAKYEGSDPEGLVVAAKERLKVAEFEERTAAEAEAERQKRAARAEAERQKKAAAELAAWRSKLKIGDDTFCGPVIEIRQPMIKIAVKAQLPGYASETWLKANEVFPEVAGCRNINGRLEPILR